MNEWERDNSERFRKKAGPIRFMAWQKEACRDARDTRLRS